MPKEFKEFPERDLVNFPHEEVSLFPHGKVRLGFIPDSFFQFFYNKTGVTGPYLLGGGLVMFILQKEILPFSGQTPYIFVFGAVMWVLIRMAGANIRGWSDKQLSAQALELENWEEGLKKEYKDAIKMESELQDCYKGVGEHIFKAKKENVLFQLEAAYRERLDTAHKEVKRRLDYLVSAEEAKRRFEQKHMVNWIVDQVLKSITPDQEKAYLSQCITDLKALAPK
jgi:F-type H+-transporting ATPase subunit b